MRLNDRLPCLALAGIQLLGVSATTLPLRQRATTSTGQLTATQHGTVFDVEVQVGNQSFFLLFDTGSADLWMVEPDFQCLNETLADTIPQEDCAFAAPYYRSTTFEAISNETFAAQYGDGPAIGTLGYENVTVAGITVPKQKIGVVNMTTNHGDGLSSGIIGFGLPILTSAHPLDFNYTSQSLLTEKVVYNPFFENAYESGQVESFFSVALDRLPENATSGPGGFLTLGALPPVSHEPNFAVAPLEVNRGIPLALSDGEPVITLWTLTVNSTSTAGKSNDTSFQACVDSGNPSNVYPRAIAAEVNAAFDPPAALIPSDDGLDMYMVECNATAPDHGVTLGNSTFFMQPEDLIIQTDDGCVSTIVGLESSDGLVVYFLGAGWMRNVVSVFDAGKGEMRFAARTENKTSTPQASKAAHTGNPGLLSVVVGAAVTAAYTMMLL